MPAAGFNLREKNISRPHAAKDKGIASVLPLPGFAVNRWKGLIHSTVRCKWSRALMIKPLACFSRNSRNHYPQRKNS